MNNNLSKLFAQLRDIWAQLGASQRLNVAAATLVLVAGLGALVFWSSHADYGLLYGGLSDAEAAKVVAALDDAKVSYKRGSNVGDILTIVVQENTTANKNNETKTERQSSLSAAITSFLYSPGASGLLTKGGTLPALAYNSDHKHDGSGAINDSESIVAHVAVRIVDVLPNRNLVVEGKRETSFSGEHQTIILRGVVRADDVAGDNTVLSYNVADATIQIIGKGTVTDSQHKGWFNRIWDKLNPF